MSNLVKSPERLKEAILEEAVQGHLTQQLLSDDNVNDILNLVRSEKQQLISEKKIHNHKKLPAIIKDEIPFKIPKNWKWMRVSNISTFPDQISINPKDIAPDTWVLNLKDIRKNTGQVKEYISNRARKVKSNKKLFQINDVLYGKMNPDLNKVIVANKNGVSSTEIFVIHLLGGINPNYIAFVMRSPYFHDLVSSKIKGLLRRSRTSDFKKFIIPIPPLAEQHRIVQRLNEILPRVDDLNRDVVKLDQIRTKFPHRLKQSLLLEAMKGHLTQQLPSDGNADDLLQSIRQKKQQLIQAGKIRRHKKLPPISKNEIPFKIPKNWKWVKLDQISNYIQRGKSPKYGKSNIPVISQKCVRWNGIDITKAKTIKRSSLSKYQKIRLLQCNDLLWNSTGTGTIGRSTLVSNNDLKDYPILVADGHVTVIRLNTILPRFIYLFISSDIVQNNINDMASGSTKQIELSKKSVENLLVPLPPLAEQHRIVSIIQKYFSLL